jgi:hypothetical protein
MAEEVIDSCGCVFCDLDLEPETVGAGPPMHVVGQDDYGVMLSVPCTKPTTVGTPAT